MQAAVYNFKKKRQQKNKGKTAYRHGALYTCTIKKEDMASNLPAENQELKQQVQELQATLDSTQAQVEHVTAEKKAYAAEASRIGQLYSEIQQHQQEDQCALLDALARDNAELRQHFSEAKNTGRENHMVSERQQRRNFKRIKSTAEAALWFLDTYGLKLDTVKVTDKNNKTTTIQYGHSGFTTSYNQMSELEKEVVESTLFVLDQYCGSEAMYHELVQVAEGDRGRPKLYQVVQCKNELNKTLLVEIKATPGACPGSQRSLSTCLQREVSERNLKSNDSLKVRVSVDGARVSRKSNFVIMTYGVITDDNVLAANGNKVLAVINGPETYSTLQESLKDLFQEMDAIQQAGHVITANGNVPVELFLGGDMKFILMVLGLSGATATHACPWCKVHKNRRHSTEYMTEHYNSPPVARSIEELANNKPVQVDHVSVTDGKPTARNKYGQKQKPLVHIPLTHVVLDELHLMLRVTDVLTNALVRDAMTKDKLAGNKKVLEGPNLQDLIAAIRKCGVTFSVWEKSNADGSSGGLYDFTSLMGPDKKNLLTSLPGNIREAGCLSTATQDKVVSLWESFSSLYDNLRKLQPSSVTEFQQNAQAWVRNFCELGNHQAGYGQARVTPYMHALVYHVPEIAKQHGSVQQFSGHGVEKFNDMARRIHHEKSNKHFATADILLATGRAEELTRRGRQRQKRPYHREVGDQEPAPKRSDNNVTE